MKDKITRIKQIIDSCTNLMHIETSLKMISNFHQEYGQKGHDEAHQLYGYLEATLVNLKTKEELRDLKILARY